VIYQTVSADFSYSVRNLTRNDIY